MAVDYTDALDEKWRIFPLHPINRDGSCGCGDESCKAQGKHPRTDGWQKTQPYDDAQMAYLEDFEGLFFGNQLLDHYGIVVSTSGLLIVDVDGRNGGFESAKKLQHMRDQCAFIVKTGSGSGEHWYFKNACEKSLRTKLHDYPGIDFKSTGFVVGCGSLHASGYRYEVIKGSPKDVTAAPDELLSLLERPERSSFTVEGESFEVDQLREMLKHVKHDAEQSYERWLAVGMALHNATEGAQEGEQLWEEWAVSQGRTDNGEISYKWHSFGKSDEPITAGSLLTWARLGGYVQPVTFEDDTDWGDVDALSSVPTEQPKSVKYDLKSPPGIVGQITDWINSRSIFPREHLAVAAALQIVSNAAGLNYYVQGLNTSINLMTFGVAGSRTGKGKILECVKECHSLIGVEPATHGLFKSSQELIRNALHHQAVLYVCDEFGSMLKKLGNAGRSGAHYLEDLLATLMALYSETNGVYYVSGDVKREIEDIAEKAVARAQKRVDDGAEDAQQDLELARKMLDSASAGIVEPYLTFFGMSEPSSFNDAVNEDPWLLTGGFLARALIFEEIETVPMIKEMADIEHGPLPEHLAMQLRAMFTAGCSGDDNARRIERKGDKKEIRYDGEAQELLKQIYSYWRDVAKMERDTGSQLESQALGATELTIKVAGVLSAATQVITVNELGWAHELVRKVTLMKISKAKSNEGMRSNDATEKGAGLLESIMATLSNTDKPIAIGTIRNRCGREINTEHVQQALDHLISTNKIYSETKKAGNGRTFTYYFIK